MTTSQQKTKQDDKFIYFTSIASTVSGILTKFLVHPLDTLKNKLQVSTLRLDSNNITRHFFKEITVQTWKQEGVKGFYKGVGISAIGSAPAFSLFMTTYEYTKQVINKKQLFEGQNFIKHMICGFNAELISCILWLPIDVLKQRLQVQTNLGIYQYKNSFDAFQKIVQSEGFFALYKGFGATLISFGTSVAIYFASYEKLKEIYIKDPKNIGFWQSFLLAAMGGCFSGFLCNPLFMAKLRLQVQQNQPNSFGYRNVFHGVAQIYMKEGFYSFFKGMVPKLIQNTPQKALSMSFTEFFRKQLFYFDEKIQQKH
ncbi:hypothetical protein ABPG72_003802 [Tetrahymena utriculariae]